MLKASSFLKSLLIPTVLVISLSLFSPFNQVHAAPEDDFVITVKTDNVSQYFGEDPINTNSADNQFIIPTYPGEAYNYNVDCNDDGIDEATAVTGDYTCDYPASGIYTIRIKDNTGSKTGFPQIYYYFATADHTKILSVDQWGTGKWKSMESAFYRAENLVISATDAPDLSQVSDMSWAFSYIKGFKQSIGDWDVSNVTNMNRMFEGIDSFNQPLENWDVSNVTNMGMMFHSAENFNQPLENWDTSNVTDMRAMFERAGKFNQPLANWDVGSVTQMNGMFAMASEFNQPIGDWNTSRVTNMSNMFEAALSFNQPLENWDVSSVTQMRGMFEDAESFNQPLGSWDTSNVWDMRWMFRYAWAFDQDLSDWNIEYLFLPRDMFEGVTLSTENYDALLNGWNSQKVIYGSRFSGGDSMYCSSKEARNNLVINHGWKITDGGFDPNCPPGSASISYSGQGFSETSANDGSVGGSIVIRLTGDTFNEFTNEVQLQLLNIPPGLTPSVSLSEENTVLTLTFEGKALLHSNADDVDNITFAFTDAAFANLSAGDIDYAIGPADSLLGVNFDDPVGVDPNSCVGFNDVRVSDPECRAIELVRNLGVMTGYTDGTNRFGKGEFLQRDEVTKIIIEIFRERQFHQQQNKCPSDPFPDVDCDSDWGAPYIYFGSNVINIITGYLSGADAGSFVQARHVTRAEFAKLIAENYPPVSGEVFYQDVSESDWFANASKFFHQNGLYTGGMMRPHEKITRDEVAEVIYRLNKKGLL